MQQLLAINSGSSSLKIAAYTGDDEQPVYTATLSRIGSAGGHLHIADAHGATLLDEARALPDHATALQHFFGWRDHQDAASPLAAVGHRVVHGGPHYHTPQRITPELLAGLREAVPLAPEHLPQAIAAIEALQQRLLDVLQVACFDTAFHRTMPLVAQQYALPRELAEAGVVRYGFHGLSYEYIVSELQRIDPAAADRRLIIAHLGSGASMAAVRGGRSVETSMGFTPLAGLVMGTRTGDVDPGVLLYLLRQRGFSLDALDELLNKQSGLLGVSGRSADVRDLLNRETIDARAAEALALFCYTAKKYIGMYTAVLGGVDTLVFTGGIGQHAAPIRARICADLTVFGITIDPARNAAHAAIISTDGAPVTVRVLATDEERMIARHTRRVLDEGEADVRV